MGDAVELAGLEAQALVYVQRGDYAAARPTLERALSLAQQLNVGPPHLARLFAQLGTLCLQLGLLKTAEAHLRRAEGLYRDLGEPMVVKLAVVLGELGQTARQEGDKGRAWKYFTKELTLWKQLDPRVGSEHLVNWAACLHACGSILAEEGKYIFARQFFEQALEFRKRCLPPDHHDIADTLTCLGNACYAQADNTSASAYLQQALSLYVTSLGDEAPVVKGIRQSLHRMSSS